MKKLTFLLALIGILAFPAITFAAPDNSQKAANNPQVVAYYDSGTHGIVGEDPTHTGTDLVMKAGNSGNFQQWFTGTATAPDSNPEGDHSIWMSVGDSTSCPSGWNLVTNANQLWGNYLQAGNYCVHNNDFASK